MWKITDTNFLWKKWRSIAEFLFGTNINRCPHFRSNSRQNIKCFREKRFAQTFYSLPFLKTVTNPWLNIWHLLKTQFRTKDEFMLVNTIIMNNNIAVTSRLLYFIKYYNALVNYKEKVCCWLIILGTMK